ncbi:MAG: hypothetical protein ACRDUV_10165 [Pseudonocardiaceae bacterium]
MAADNTGRQCARCQRASRDKLIAPPEVPAEFWLNEQLRDAFAAQHMGRVARAYRTHPYHYAIYGPSGISQTLLGLWLSLRQPQVSRFETGPPIKHLDTLQHWARVLRIPPRLLWFQLPAEDERQPVTTESVSSRLADALVSNGVLEPPAEIVARRAELQTSGLTGELVAELERFLAYLPDRYEITGPLVLAPEVVDARRLVHRLLTGNQQLKQRAQLFELAGRLSGQLSYMAVNLGNFSAAQAYGAAYRVYERFPPAAGMTPCISFGIYSEARTASNAATAYLALRQTKQVLSYAERAREIVDARIHPAAHP